MSTQIITIPVSEVRFVKELYPRSKPNDAAIERYRAAIELLPPIHVARGSILVDGYHRWQAHSRDDLGEIRAIDLGDLSDIEIKKESYRRNKAHGQQLDTSDKKRGADDLYRSGINDFAEIADLIGVTEKTAAEYCRDARRDKKDEQKAKAWDLWLDCRSYREIAGALGEDSPDEDTIGRWVSAKSKELENADAPDSRQHFNIWQFQTSDKDSGQQSYFGAIPPQVIENLLWFYTEPGEIVVDPFAGSGTTVDVAKAMGRRVWAADIRGNHYCPHLPIHQHDITAGWPDAAPRKPDLVFLDPPYWKQAVGKYSDAANEMAEMSLEAFMDAWNAVVAALPKQATRVSYIISATQDDDGSVVDHATAMLPPFWEEGWRIEQRIIVPYSSQQVNGAAVTWARENKRMLKLYRDLVVLTR